MCFDATNGYVLPKTQGLVKMVLYDPSFKFKSAEILSHLTILKKGIIKGRVLPHVQPCHFYIFCTSDFVH